MTMNGLRRAGPSLPRDECYCGVCTMQTLAGVADAIASVQNDRKMILFIGEDLPFAENSSAASAAECRGLLRDAREALVRAIDRSCVMVHAFNPPGLEAGAPGADACPSDAKEPASAVFEPAPVQRVDRGEVTSSA